MKVLPCLTLLLLSALVASCSTAAPSAPTTVVHPLGSRQCEPGGTSPQALADRLRSAGIAVASVSCGHDGRMRPAVCGAPDGQLAVIEIDGAQLPQARAIGFVPWAESSEARRRPCPLDGR